MKACIAILLLAVPASALAGGTAPPEPALARIEAAGLQARMRFLSHDLLEGRTDRGYDVAATWVASQLEAIGFAPAGEDGTWFQEVPLARARLEALPLTVNGRGGPRTIQPPHVLMGPGAALDTLDVDAEVVFAGYGIQAPRLGRDDYRHLDVRGKVVVVLANAPEGFPGDDRAHHGSLHRKEELAAARGAVGLVHLFDVAADAPLWRGARAAVSRGSVRWVPRAGGTTRQVAFTAGLDREGCATLLAGTGHTLASLQRKGRPGQKLGVRVAAKGAVTRTTMTSRNVAGLLRGSDPNLAAEVVVYTAHLDHLGVHGDSGDRVYNGAIDNASGVAGILEIAVAFAAAPVRPARSIMILAVGAEELGLLGSDYFAAYPTVPMASIVANVNLDMLPLQPALLPLREVIAFGAEHSSLGAVVKRAASGVGLNVVPDPMPEQRIFVRSDQYSFVRRGVPAVMLTAGGGSGNWVDALKSWLGSGYHSPGDDMASIGDVSGAVLLTRLSFHIGWDVATDPVRPRWNPGSFFGETFSD